MKAVQADADPAEEERDPSRSESPEAALQAVVRQLRDPDSSCEVGARYHSEHGAAVAYRRGYSRSLLIIGDSRMASELRKLISVGAAPGWDLYPLPPTRTPIKALNRQLHRLSGSVRHGNLLLRSGFAYAEEVAALSDQCLFDIPQGGERFVRTIREGIRILGLEQPEPVTIDSGPPESQQPTVLQAADLDALRTAAAWAVTEAGASTLGDLLLQVSRSPRLPPDIARAWDHLRLLDLRPVAGSRIPRDELATLADQLLAELDDRSRVILTTRTFAPKRRTLDSLAKELGVSRGRVGQLEKGAFGKLRKALADDHYAPLRWRANSVRSRGASWPVDQSDTARPWMDRLLAWLSENL